MIRQRLGIIVIGAFMAVAAICHAGDKPVHLFILSGQSNMKRMSPNAGFVSEAKKLFPDGDVVYFKVAQSGQPIRYWVEEWNSIAEKHKKRHKIDQTKFYKPILEKYQELLQKHKTFASVTFCWMQGERDAKSSIGAAYADALKQLIANLRRDLKQPKMAVVIGRIGDYRTSAGWEAVRKIQVAVANEDQRGAWVDTDDLNNMEKNGEKSNGLHYTGEGYAVLGKRYARQAKAIHDGKKPDPAGRPE